VDITQLGPIDIASPISETLCILNENRTMANVQKHNNYKALRAHCEDQFVDEVCGYCPCLSEESHETPKYTVRKCEVCDVKASGAYSYHCSKD
jgi:hypothetical protein